MVKYFFLTFFLFSALQGTTQIVANRVNKYITLNSIDTFLVYSFPCSGSISFDSCHYEVPHYLFWQQNGEFFLKRFDYSKTYHRLQLDILNPLTFYLNYKRIIEEEQIRQPTYYEIKKSKKKVDTLMVTSSIDHSCYHKFRLPFTKKEKYKYADTYALNFEIFDNGKKNIYYDYNQKIKLKGLIDLTESLIAKIKDENMFQEE